MHKNEQLLRDLVDGFQNKNLEKTAACFSPSIIWRWLGTEFITDMEASTYVGLEDVAAKLLATDEGMTDYRIEEILALSASESIGTLWMKCSYKDGDGKHHDMEENWVFLFSDGVISEVWDYSRQVFLEKVRNGEISGH